MMTPEEEYEMEHCCDGDEEPCGANDYCDQPVFAHGLCEWHFRRAHPRDVWRWQKGSRPGVPAETRRDLARRYGGAPGKTTYVTCHCGAKGEIRWQGARVRFVGFEIEHLRPRCEGGTNALENLQLLCPRCNADKARSDRKRRSRSPEAKRFRREVRRQMRARGFGKKAPRPPTRAYFRALHAAMDAARAALQSKQRAK